MTDIFPKYLTPQMKHMTRDFFRSFRKLQMELEEEEEQHMV